MSERGVVVLDSQLLAEVSEGVVVKLLAIVGDEDPGNSKAANDVLPNEVSDIFLCDSSQRFHLNPFSKVVDPNNKELELPYNGRKQSHYVNPH